MLPFSMKPIELVRSLLIRACQLSGPKTLNRPPWWPEVFKVPPICLSASLTGTTELGGENDIVSTLELGDLTLSTSSPLPTTALKQDLSPRLGVLGSKPFLVLLFGSKPRLLG
jgi:hypothetical protein